MQQHAIGDAAILAGRFKGKEDKATRDYSEYRTAKIPISL
jgi:hypothetical protein